MLRSVFDFQTMGFTGMLIRLIRLISTLLAGMIAIATLAFILGLYEGVQRDIQHVIDDSIGERIRVFWSPTDLSEAVRQMAADRPEELEILDSPNIDANYELPQSMRRPPALKIQQIQQLSSVKAVAWEVYQEAFGASASVNLPVRRVPFSIVEVNRLKLAQGRLPTVAEGTDAVVLGHDAAQFLFGNRDPLGQVIEPDPNATPMDEIPAVANPNGTLHPNGIKPYPYKLTVVGVLAPLSPLAILGDGVFYNATIFQFSDILDPQTDLGSISVLPQPGQQTQAISDIYALETKPIRSNHRYVVQAEGVQQERMLFSRFQTLLKSGLGAMVGLAGIIAFITLTIAQYFQALLLMRSYGIQRSMGASRWLMLRDIVGRGMLMGAISSVGGLLIVWALAPYVTQLSTSGLHIGRLSVIVIISMGLLLGELTSLLIGWRVGTLPPTTLLRGQASSRLHHWRWLWGGLGIVASMIALILTLALRQGLMARLDGILDWTGKQTIGAVSWQNRPDPLHPPAYLTIQDYQAVKAAFPTWTVAWMGNPFYTAMESSASVADVQKLVMRCGRWFTPADEAAQKPLLVLGSERAAMIARDRKVASPCEIKEWRGVPVIGVLDRWETSMTQGMNLRSVYFPIGGRVTPSLDQVDTGWDWDRMRFLDGQILVKIPETDDLGQAAEKLKAFLAPRHPEGEPKLILPAGITNDLLQRRNQIYTLAGVMAILCLLIGGVGLMNLTFISVLSRAREIGIRRAVGATKRAILGQIIGETVRICVGAALVGAVAGLAIARVLQVRFGWPPTTPWQLIVLAAAIALVVGVVFGAVPAWWAANLPPTRAIKTE